MNGPVKFVRKTFREKTCQLWVTLKVAIVWKKRKLSKLGKRITLISTKHNARNMAQDDTGCHHDN